MQIELEKDDSPLNVNKSIPFQQQQQQQFVSEDNHVIDTNTHREMTISEVKAMQSSDEKTPNLNIIETNSILSEGSKAMDPRPRPPSKEISSRGSKGNVRMNIMKNRNHVEAKQLVQSDLASTMSPQQSLVSEDKGKHSVEKEKSRPRVNRRGRHEGNMDSELHDGVPHSKANYASKDSITELQKQLTEQKEKMAEIELVLGDVNQQSKSYVPYVLSVKDAVNAMTEEHSNFNKSQIELQNAVNTLENSIFTVITQLVSVIDSCVAKIDIVGNPLPRIDNIESKLEDIRSEVLFIFTLCKHIIINLINHLYTLDW
jgi:hypothetical protein